MNQSERRLFLIQSLLAERPPCRKQEIPADAQRQKVLLRGLQQGYAKSPLIFESASRQIRGLVFWVSVFGQRPLVWRPFCIGSTTN